MWYTVLYDREDTDWGFGSYDFDTALVCARRLKENGNPDVVIGVVEGVNDKVLTRYIEVED